MYSSDATPADLLTASMAAEPFDPHTCTCVQALVELGTLDPMCCTVHYADRPRANLMFGILRMFKLPLV